MSYSYMYVRKFSLGSEAWRDSSYFLDMPKGFFSIHNGNTVEILELIHRGNLRNFKKWYSQVSSQWEDKRLIGAFPEYELVRRGAPHA